MQKRKPWSEIIILLSILVIPACVSTPTTQNQASGLKATETSAPAVTAQVSETPAGATQTPTSLDPTAACPSATEGTTQYISRENGFCLLYPLGFTENAYSEQAKPRLRMIDQLPGSARVEPPIVSLVIETNGPADGMDSVQYAQKWQELFTGGSSLRQETGTVGGLPAVILYGLSGAEGAGEQGAFLVANKSRYRITLIPQFGDIPQLDERAHLLWNTITASIVFFPPEAALVPVTPEAVCPQANTETRQYIDLGEGFCLLYPADFTEAPDFPGKFQGGPVLEYGTAWGDVQTSLTVGTFGPSGGQTIMQVFEPLSQFVDTASVEQTTISGYPAVVFRDARGPWASRQAMILVNGFTYTIVAQPWEPERYAAVIPFLDRLWDTVTGSLAFFDPWR